MRHFNLMLLNSRAPKIRHLNASHSLLIEMEKYVRKVHELEHKVHELEMPLQLKELVETHTVIIQDWEAEKAAVKQSQKVVISEEAQEAFAERIATATMNAEILSKKRSEEEANILRSWHQKKLRLAIDKMSQIPGHENEMLPQPATVTEEDLQRNTNIILGLESLIDFANRGVNEMSFNEEALVEDIHTKEAPQTATISEGKHVETVEKMKEVTALASNIQVQVSEQARKMVEQSSNDLNQIRDQIQDIKTQYGLSNQRISELDSGVQALLEKLLRLEKKILNGF